MKNKIIQWFDRKYPQSYIIARPFWGALLIALFWLMFVILYRPLGAHEAPGLGFVGTIAVYSFAMAGWLYLLVRLLKLWPYFAQKKEWTFLKELAAIVILLLGIGIGVYFMAFIVEPPADRWNLPTFLDSLKRASLLGIIPFAIFTLINVRYLISQTFEPGAPATSMYPGEDKILINSQLKKQKLSFYPAQLLYAEAEGNYIAFYLLDETGLSTEPSKEKGVKKKIIRNSINNIEQQLSEVPVFLRTHRAFIVNLSKVVEKQGNISGYRLRLKGTKTEVPVSRQNTKLFDERFEIYQN